VRGRNQGGSKKLYNGELVLGIELDFGRIGGKVEIISCLCIPCCIQYPWIKRRLWER